MSTLVGMAEEAWSDKQTIGALGMDIAAAFPSVAEKCLLRNMRNMEIGKELVEWTSSFIRECRVLWVRGRC